jgi:3-hydroxyacyl-CoA dehydrogenase/enoyl-CoA hydratase/3-hydroxybutyryl-CoA epimerase
MYQNLRFEVDADGIALITMDVADRPMNVLTPGFVADYAACVERVASDPAIRGAVLSSGKAAFMAGADIKDMVNAYDRGITLAEAREQVAALTRLFRRVETCGKPFAAAIHGVALGGGFEIALACHYRVISDDPKSAVGQPEVSIGLLPGAGGTQRVPRLIGVMEGLKFLTEGRPMSAPEALKKGLVHEVAPQDQIVERARRWILGGGEALAPWDRKGFKVPGGAGAMHPGAAQVFMAGTALTAGRTQHNYPAPFAILAAVYEGTQLPIDLGLAVEGKYFATLLAGPVARNLMRTMFVNKGLADKLVRRPAGVPASRVTKLGVLGAGMMGAGIAYVSARAGMQVVLIDATVEQAARGKAHAEALLAKDTERGKLRPEEAAAILARVQPTTDYAALAGCELVIEAVFELRELKADVTRKAEAVLGKDAVFASNTSTLPITGLAAASTRPANFIGIHFFSPVEKMPLVEVIVGRKSSQATLARALDYVAQLRKTPIVVNDSRGFYTSRVFGTYCNEGQALLAEGVAPALIENAARMAGMPVGPLAVSDEVSLELQHKIMRQTAADLGAKYQPPPGYAVVERMVAGLGRLGRKSGGGFYDYPPGLTKRLWPGLAKEFPPAEVQPEVAEVRKRLLYVQALETVRCLEEGVIEHPADADLGSILGWGFPAWTGGTLSLIETVGLQTFIKECQVLAKKCGKRFEPSRKLKAMAREGQRFYPLPGEAQPAS